MGVNPGVSIVFEPLIVASSVDARKLAPIARHLAGLEGDVVWELSGDEGVSYVFRVGRDTLRIRHGKSSRPIGRITTSVPAFFSLVTHRATCADLAGLGELELHGPVDAARLVEGFVDYLDDLRSARGSEGRVTSAWLDFAVRSSRTGHSFREPSEPASR